MTEVAEPAPSPTAAARRLVLWEIVIVLGLSLGRSAVYSILTLIQRLTAEPSLSEQTATLNPSRSDRPLIDLVYQLLGIGFALVPVALALFLLGAGATRRIGLDRLRPARDGLRGLALAAAIGLPGLAFYAIGRALDITVTIRPSALGSEWWAIPILILAALQNGLLEEVVVVAYLTERLERLRLRWPVILLISAVLRGSYHLYQGIGPFFGNLVMGLVFAEWYRRTRRVWPLVIAHTLLDVVAFVGYALLPSGWLSALHLG